jgi:HEPN domain-containing protein
MSEKNNNWQEWWLFAEEDFSSAKDLMKTGHYSVCCFHCQQAAEKALKAVMLSLGLDNIRLHNLIALLNLVVEHYPKLESYRDKITILDAYYSSTRYPNGIRFTETQKLFNDRDGKLALSAADDLLKCVRTLLFNEV